METERWVIGNDNDGTLFLQLLYALKPLGFVVDESWNPADLDSFPLSAALGDILIEADTSRGLVVSGAPELISAIRDRYHRQHGNSVLD